MKNAILLVIGSICLLINLVVNRHVFADDAIYQRFVYDEDKGTFVDPQLGDWVKSKEFSFDATVPSACFRSRAHSYEGRIISNGEESGRVIFSVLNNDNRISGHPCGGTLVLPQFLLWIGTGSVTRPAREVLIRPGDPGKIIVLLGPMSGGEGGTVCSPSPCH